MPTKLPTKKVKVSTTEWSRDQPNDQEKTDFGDFEFHADENKMMNVEHLPCDLNGDEEKDKKSKTKQKKDIKQAFKNIKSKFSRKRNKNGVKEISIKPETETPSECWASEVVSIDRRARREGSQAGSSRAGSANSKGSTVEDLEEDDGIEVIYDAAIQGGKEL